MQYAVKFSFLFTATLFSLNDLSPTYARATLQKLKPIKDCGVPRIFDAHCSVGHRLALQHGRRLHNPAHNNSRNHIQPSAPNGCSPGPGDRTSRGDVQYHLHEERVGHSYFSSIRDSFLTTLRKSFILECQWSSKSFFIQP
jgi:hypothetical protein